MLMKRIGSIAKKRRKANLCRVENKRAAANAASVIAMVAVILVLTGFCRADNGGHLGSNASPEASGRIELPLIESLTGNFVEVSGYTENIDPETGFIWLVIEKKDRNVCWPGNRPLPPNCRFNAAIDATGHVNAFQLSLIMVDRERNREIIKWQASDRSKGLQISSRDVRLHSIQLWNQKLNM